MKKYLTILSFSLFIFIINCENKESANKIIPLKSQKKIIPQREKILNRHNNGEKKVVVVYQGEGSNEKLIKRSTYNRKGQIELLENKINNITDYYFKGALVKRKFRNSYYNFFSLLRSDTIKSGVFMKWFINPYNTEGDLAMNLLSSSSPMKIVGTTVQGNWIAEGSYSLSNPNLDLNKMLKDYSISFDYSWGSPNRDDYIYEFGKYLSNGRRYSKKYKIIKLEPSKGNAYEFGGMNCVYVEVDYRNNSIIGEEYSQYLDIKDPFNISFSPGSDLKRDEYAGVKRSEILWD